MKILKPGKVEMRKFVCYRCECEFTATSGEIEVDTTAEDELVCCPQKGCGVYMTWDSGEPYEEPTQDDTREKLIWLIRNFRATNLETADCEADFLIANGVIIKEN